MYRTHDLERIAITLRNIYYARWGFLALGESDPRAYIRELIASACPSPKERERERKERKRRRKEKRKSRKKAGQKGIRRANPVNHGARDIHYAQRRNL